MGVSLDMLNHSSLRWGVSDALQLGSSATIVTMAKLVVLVHGWCVITGNFDPSRSAFQGQPLRLYWLLITF